LPNATSGSGKNTHYLNIVLMKFFGYFFAKKNRTYEISRPKNA